MRISLPAWEVFAAIQKTRSPVKGVPCIIDGRTFFGRFMRGTQENPLLGSGHLSTGGWLTMSLKPYG